MRKLLNKMLRMVPLLALVLSFAQTNAQRPYAPSAEEDFLITIQNVVQPAGTQHILEFDVYIVDTDPTQDLQMATFQAGINFNISGMGATFGATMTTVVAGSSNLPPAMAPISVSTTAAGLIRVAGRAAPGCGAGYIISTTAPGTRIATFRITNPGGAAFTANSTPNFSFTSSTATNPSYATRFAYYAAATCLNTQAVVTPGVNANVLENPVLNAPSCTAPLAFAVTGGGAYCQGGAGLPVGLAGSEAGVTYTLYKDGIAQVPTVAGTGSAISFGNQLAGNYTVIGTKCTPPLNTPMTGNAVITETPASTQNYTASACDTYTWAVNGQTYNASGIYTFVDGCVTHVLNLTITPSSTVNYTASACDTYTWAVNGQTYTATGIYTFVDGCVTHVLNLTITPSSTQNYTASACDSYLWSVNGVTYNASGTYTFVAGCVTHVLNLTITPSSTQNYTASACDSYTWAISGLTYNASGTYTFVDGCVTHVLNLTITPSSTQNYTAAACDSYLWSVNGVTYNASGTYTFVDGCVTHVLNLTITPSSTQNYTASACDSYTWAISGLTYNASGTYTFVDGCVTHVLNLTITPSSTQNYTAAACDTYTWAVNGMTYNASGTYTFVDGCVTHVLNLTITPSGTNEYTVSACDSYFWAVSGQTYTASGDYTFINGCSTNILHLTITASSTQNYTASACDSYTWAISGLTYNASGVYNFVDGCVTHVLNLTITPSSTQNYTASACDSYTWAVNGMTYNASGTYTFVDGCVTHVLNLTITVSVTPAVSIVESANNVVAGTSVTFTASPVNGGSPAYAWFVNGLPAGTNNFQFTYVPLNGDVVYVVMTSSLGCVTVPSATSNAITMVVNPAIPTGAVWTGLANNGNWFDAGNWDTGVPGAITNVTIPGGLGANYPMNAGVCNNLLVGVGASLMVNPTVGGTATVQSFVSAGQYHFISSPVAAATAMPTYPASTFMRRYDELQPVQQWVNITGATVLNPFVGYSTFIPAATGNQTVNYVGALNDGIFSNAGLTFTANSTPSYDGYNLLGNPYASRINLEGGVALSNVDNAIYFWNPAINAYSYWVIGTGGVNGASANVPVGQGFFVKVSTPGVGTFGVSNAVRTNAVQPFYKNSINNVIRLKAEGDIYSDETMISFNAQATSQFDSQFDAYKLKASEVNHLYTKTADGSELAINALTSIEENTSIPVYFEVAQSGTYSLTASELETIAGNIPVWLEDLKTGAVQNLRENAVYAFNADVNDNAFRFKLTFAVLGVDDKPLQNVNIWSVDKNIHMQLPTVVKGNVRVSNAAGQTLLNTEINAVGEYVIHAPVATGVYMVTITSNEGTVTKKVFIK